MNYEVSLNEVASSWSALKQQALDKFASASLEKKTLDKPICNDIDYSRPTGFREGVRDKVWEDAKDEHGRVRDPVTGQFMSKDNPWDMGHKPGFEFRKHQESAQERGISRNQFLDEYNNPDHYRPELPSSNRSHRGEDVTSQYFGN